MDIALLNKELGARPIGDGTYYFACSNVSSLPSECSFSFLVFLKFFKKKFILIQDVAIQINGKQFTLTYKDYVMSVS